MITSVPAVHTALYFSPSAEPLSDGDDEEGGEYDNAGEEAEMQEDTDMPDDSVHTFEGHDGEQLTAALALLPLFCRMVNVMSGR